MLQVLQKSLCPGDLFEETGHFYCLSGPTCNLEPLALPRVTCGIVTVFTTKGAHTGSPPPSKSKPGLEPVSHSVSCSVPQIWLSTSHLISLLVFELDCPLGFLGLRPGLTLGFPFVFFLLVDIFSIVRG